MSRHVIDVTPPTPAWRKSLPRATALARIAAEAALKDGAKSRRGSFEVSIVLAGDALARRLNRDYRHQDYVPNVLSFPAGEMALPLLGDVVVAHGTARREAKSENKTLAAHLTHLVVHGVLHLLGYDHGHAKDAAVMERLESAIMARLGYADPYAVVTPRNRPRR